MKKELSPEMKEKIKKMIDEAGKRAQAEYEEARKTKPGLTYLQWLDEKIHSDPEMSQAVKGVDKIKKAKLDDGIARCGLCGEPMPKGEEMFKFHGYSGDCPKKG